MELTDTEILAITKVIDTKDAKIAREDVKAGSYNVNMDVHIEGQVVVGKDSLMKSTSNTLSINNLILVLHYAGVTRKSAIKAIKEAFDGKKSAKELETYDAIKDMFKEMADNLPLKTRKGTVKFTGAVEAIQQPVADNKKSAKTA